MDLGGGDHVVRGDGDGAVALAQARDPVRDGLEAGLPRALDAEGDLVAARAGYVTGMRFKARRGAARGTHTASTEMLHWTGLSFMALCSEHSVWNCTSTHVCDGISSMYSKAFCGLFLPVRKAGWCAAKGG